jgi:phosphofructokinase-like protein
VGKGRVRIGVLTGGGDCPGLNAAIRAVVKGAANAHGAEVVGIGYGFRGLVEDGLVRPLDERAVRGILALGGTILGTTNRADPFRWPEPGGTSRDASAEVIRNARRLGLDALVAMGGDGTLRIAAALDAMGLPTVGVPKTIDGDVNGTDATLGFDTARAVCTEALDRLATTAEAHDRVMVLEVMGRESGFLALHAAVAGGADVALVPEIPWDAAAVVRHLEAGRRRGRPFGLVVVAEGAAPRGGAPAVERVQIAGRGEVKLGGAGKVAADAIAAAVDLEVRVTTLGHLQRGGTPSPQDRLLGARFGEAAVALAAARRGGRMVALRCGEVVDAPLSDAAGRRRLDPADPLVGVARAIGISFGDGGR